MELLRIVLIFFLLPSFTEIHRLKYCSCSARTSTEQSKSRPGTARLRCRRRRRRRRGGAAAGACPGGGGDAGRHGRPSRGVARVPPATRGAAPREGAPGRGVRTRPLEDGTVRKRIAMTSARASRYERIRPSARRQRRSARNKRKQSHQEGVLDVLFRDRKRSFDPRAGARTLFSGIAPVPRFAGPSGPTTFRHAYGTANGMRAKQLASVSRCESKRRHATEQPWRWPWPWPWWWPRWWPRW